MGEQKTALVLLLILCFVIPTLSFPLVVEAQPQPPNVDTLGPVVFFSDSGNVTILSPKNSTNYVNPIQIIFTVEALGMFGQFGNVGVSLDGGVINSVTDFINKTVVQSDFDWYWYQTTVLASVMLPTLSEGTHNVTVYYGWQYLGIPENPSLQRYEVFGHSTIEFMVVSGQLSNSETVIIHEDGTVEPTHAPIQIVENVFNITDDIDALTIKKENIVVNGNGHTLSGLGQTVSILASGVTIKNLLIKGSEVGILLDKVSNVTVANNTIMQTTAVIPEVMQTSSIFIGGGGNHTIFGNNIVENYWGIYIGTTSEHNSIFGNNITNNNYGIILDSSNNKIYQNNFFNNTQNCIIRNNSRITWNMGFSGNYWRDYTGTDNNGDGIGDMPYVIDENNQDDYPLMNSVDIATIPEFPSWAILLLVLTIIVFLVVVKRELYAQSFQNNP
jgi:parallel beta-helix repeat protein